MLIDDLITCALELTDQKTIKTLRIGPGYSGVLLESGLCGIAATLRQLEEPPLPDTKNYQALKLPDLIRLLKSPEHPKAALGLAAINALLGGVPDLKYHSGDCREFIPYKNTDCAGIVGAILPLVNFLNGKVKKIYVFENHPCRRQEGMFPQEKEAELLPQCDLLLVTASSLVNHTLEQVLHYSRNARFKGLIGASAPLAPELFKNYGLNLLSGIKIQKPEEVMEVIAYGGTSDLKGRVEKVNLLL